MEFTGERFIPGETGEIKYTHLHRYALAQEWVRDKAVLDIACGEGYGVALLARAARTVVGVDIDPETIGHASRQYGGLQNVKFLHGSCESIPLPDQSVEVVTSFETIEHHDRHLEMLREIKRVLRPDGLLIISSPNRTVYSEQYDVSNSFHVKELDYAELMGLLGQHFKHIQVYGQRTATGSFIFPLDSAGRESFAAYTSNGDGVCREVSQLESPVFYIAVCSDMEIVERRALDSVYIDGHDDLLQQTLDELKRLRLAYPELVEQYVQLNQTLADIRASLGFKLVSRVFWPLAGKLVPVAVRSRLKGAAASHWRGLSSRRAEEVGELVWKIDSNLSAPFVVGRGNLFYLSGSCYHTRKKIKKLAVLMDGRARWVDNYLPSCPEQNFETPPQSKESPGHSLAGGFWTTLPFEEPSAARDVSLALRAVLDDGTESEANIGTLRLAPSEQLEEQPAQIELSNRVERSEPVVAICMTTYNPTLDLLDTQIESLIRQTHRNWVCLISDDCSEPQIFDEIQGMAARDPRFRVYRNSSRLGFYRNFERCLKLVPSAVDFVAFSDQDDDWYPDKLASCLAEFQEDIQMVYSDMDIVTREGEVISNTYWTGRKNNYTNLETLLLANTVTGASMVFHASLLRELLPFPEMATDLYHDHWVACLALTKGRIGYVDRPLYAYRQHSNNIIGHAVAAPARFWPQFLSIAYLLSLLPKRTAIFDEHAWQEYETYRTLPVRIAFIARALKLRITDAPAKKRAILERFERLDRSLPVLIIQAVKYKIFRQPTLGIEWLCLKSALAMRLLKFRLRYARPRTAVTATSAKATVSRVEAEPALDAGITVDWIRQKIAPLRLSVSQTVERRVNIIVSTLDFKYWFAGHLCVFNLALRLKREGYSVRLVIVDPCDYAPAEWNRRIADYDGLQNLFEQVQTAYLFERSRPLEVSPHDAFIATSWWTAHVAHHASRNLKRERFIYLIQEYEPLFHPAGTLYALSEQAYTFAHHAVFSTGVLREYFEQQRIGVYSRNGKETGAETPVVIQNAVHEFHISEEQMRARKVRRLLFYARPDQNHFARNMFELGALALREAVREGYFNSERWEFHGIGAVTRFKSVPLHRNVELKMLPKLTLPEYWGTLPTYDLGLSLMMTPHPSLTPLDMAAAGLVTVTNTFATKTAEKMYAISRNLIAVTPTVDGIKAGLIKALGEVHDYGKRAAGARLNWSTSWDKTFDRDVIAAFRKYIGW